MGIVEAVGLLLLVVVPSIIQHKMDDIISKIEQPDIARLAKVITGSALMLYIAMILVAIIFI